MSKFYLFAEYYPEITKVGEKYKMLLLYNGSFIRQTEILYTLPSFYALITQCRMALYYKVCFSEFLGFSWQFIRTRAEISIIPYIARGNSNT